MIFRMYRRKPVDSRRSFDEEEFDRNLRKRKIVSWVVIGVIVPIIFAAFYILLRQEHYLAVSMMLLAVTILPFMVSFEYKHFRAREIVLLSVMTSFCVTVNILCSHTIPLHGGTAMVVISGIALGPEAGFMTGVLGRFVCNFFDGQGPWTPWQMISWGIIGFISGVVFCKPKEAKSGGRYNIFICIAASLVTGYLWFIIFGGSLKEFAGWMLYAFGAVGIVIGCLFQRKKLPADRTIMALYTFCIVFVLYGGIMNFGTMIMQNAYNQGDNPVNMDTLRALYITGVPYDISHALGAAFCTFIIGESLLAKLERVQIKYGIYRN